MLGAIPAFTLSAWALAPIFKFRGDVGILGTLLTGPVHVLLNFVRRAMGDIKPISFTPCRPNSLGGDILNSLQARRALHFSLFRQLKNFYAAQKIILRGSRILTGQAPGPGPLSGQFLHVPITPCPMPKGELIKL